MKTIIEILNERIEKNFYTRNNLVKKLKVNQIEFVKDFLIENEKLEFHKFHEVASRLFITSKTCIANGKVYQHEEIFPKKNITHVAVELIEATINSYYNQGE